MQPERRERVSCVVRAGLKLFEPDVASAIVSASSCWPKMGRQLPCTTGDIVMMSRPIVRCWQPRNQRMKLNVPVYPAVPALCGLRKREADSAIVPHVNCVRGKPHD